jgi:hypothetical protein
VLSIVRRRPEGNQEAAMAVRSALTSVAAASLLLALASGARADLMAACSPEIGRLCADVRQGRGRITACLASQREDLAPACLAEVQAATGRRVIPQIAREILNPGFRADLPPACMAAAARFCPEVRPGDGRVLACLYARSDRLDSACSSAARHAVGR